MSFLANMAISLAFVISMDKNNYLNYFVYSFYNISMINFVEITEDKRINEFINLANDIWHEYFPFILSENQINYMLNKFQSFDVTKKQLDEGYKYYFVALNEHNIGYFVYKKEVNCLFLSKLYFKKEFTGNERYNLNIKETLTN